MTEHTDQPTAQPNAVPARIYLDDFIEAVTRGVTRALAAQDEVSGYLLQGGGDPRSTIRPIVIGGIFAVAPTTHPTDLAELLGSQGATFKGS